jgi:predicted enzyme related to lactoylglutathione lyase
MTTYFHVDDLEDRLGRLREIGASQQGEVRDVGGGKLVVTLTDPDGNVVGLSQEP